MLILSRRAGEAILIDGGVRIVVLGTDGNGVRLGIEAPSSVAIVREEVAQRIAEENVRAGATEAAQDWLRSLSEPNAGEADAPEPTDGANESSPDEPGPADAG